ncbi:MAG: type IV secretory system conjugative DNA transfer family protein [Candidatus Bathyarchaeota archaeon]|nr:type IV secretory system conjugative DNA transfer family protein [Candidatus Termiticorpusculum sp.]
MSKNNNNNSNSPSVNNKNRLHVLGIDAEVDPCIGRKLERGIYASDRIHTLVMGFPGCGKTRFLLSMIKQHIDKNEGFLVLDSHSDLAQLVLSHIPPEQWDRVVYINPWTAFEEKFDNRVVQINFLDYDNPLERDIVARMFMDTLEKIYDKWWGPRLDMILLNALYLVMEKENPKLHDLYKALSDKAFRGMLTAKCRDQLVRLFWEKQYDKMPQDAAVAVLTKLYRLVQERIIVPTFMTNKSCINFREVMDEKKIVIVDLPEGKITTDISNFLGSLILSSIYNAGMSRGDISEEKRQPFFVYADEAYRYTTQSIPETLQSLRKFKVFMTLASQYLTQYRRDIQDAITQTCETIISFRVGEDTARTLAKFYPPQHGYQTLMNLPRHLFFVSTPFCGNREYQVLETLDYKTGQTNPEDVIRYSLEKYGRRVDVVELMGQVKNRSLQEEFLDWPITPTEWIILLTIRQHGGAIDQQTLQEQLLRNPTNLKPCTLTETQLQTALKNLAINTAKRDAWLTTYKETTTQQQAYPEIQLNGKPETNSKEVFTQIWRLDLSDKKAKQLLDTKFYGEKSGGVKHIQAIMAQCKLYWQNGWITQIDTGETEKSIADIYVTPIQLAISAEETKKSYSNLASWDYLQSFAVEIETYPTKHFDRLKDHYTRNKKMGFPTLFIVPTQTDAEKLKEKLAEWKATYVQNTAQFKPNNSEQVTIEINNILNDQNNHQTTKTPQPPTTKLIKTTLESSNNTPPKSVLENSDSFEDKPVGLSLGDLEKERLMLKFADEGWHFRLKEVKNKNYLCVRKSKEEHSLGSYTKEIKYIAEKNKIKITAK